MNSKTIINGINNNPYIELNNKEKSLIFELSQQQHTIGRDRAHADLVVPEDWHVIGRCQAVLRKEGEDYRIYDGDSIKPSTNGLYVEHTRITPESGFSLSNGTEINIGQNPENLIVLRYCNPSNLVVKAIPSKLSVTLKNRSVLIGRDANATLPLVLESNGKRRLDDVSFAIEPGQFVALVGGSGAGKSTLMRTLLGTEQTTQGVVYLNGEDLRKNFNIYRTQIGYVPQDDIIHRELTVGEVLTYAAKLRLPPDTDVKQVLEKTLQDVEMSHRRNAKVSELSGGQRKRVSIGVELLADPKLFFLDEPTSGLDPGLDKKMMQLLRKLANQGRTVILVTHATANIKLCDRVVFLGQGGRLCYFGPREECLKFFGVKEDFADIYNQLEHPETVIDQAERFRQSDDYRRYVANHLSAENRSSPVNAGNKQQKSASFVKQLSILTQRYFQIQKRDRVNLALSLLTAPIGISLITLALAGKQPLVLPEQLSADLAPLALRVLFVFTCAAL